MRQRGISFGFGMLLFGLFGLPIVLSTAISVGFGLPIAAGFLGKLGSDDGERYTRPSAEDLAFGGNSKNIAQLHRQLLARTSGIKGGRHRARSLAVAVVSVGGWEAEASGRAAARTTIDIDLARAEGSAILVIADRPVEWTTSNVQAWHRGKLAIEGSAVFDLGRDVPDGLLAAYRIRAFGTQDTTDPQDVEPGAAPGSMRRFCASAALWAQYFGVPAGMVRLWKLDSPSRIGLDQGHIMQSGRMASGVEYVGDMCAGITPPARQPTFKY